MREILSIDIGTSSLKAGVLTEQGRLVSFVRRPLLEGGESLEPWDAFRWYRALREALPSVVASRRIDAVVLSGNGPTVVAVDRDGAIVDPVLLWLDGREERIPGDPSYFLPKVAWLAKHRADAFTRIHRVHSFPEYLVYLLTGEALTHAPTEEFARHVWSPESIATYGLPADLFPPEKPLGEVAGLIKSSVAEELGLPPGLPVVTGGPDFLMSLVGTDTLEAGRTCDRAGTSEGINHCVAHPRSSEGLRLLPHAIPGLYNLAGILSSTGLLFEWFRGISNQRGRDYGDMMLDIVREEAETDAPWFFPSAHEGAAWSFRSGMFIGLGARHTSASMGRAVVLSIGFAVREAVEILASVGAHVNALRACGGQAKNAIWNQMKADIVGTPILVPEVADAELVGNLCVGLVALGRFSTLREAAAEIVTLAQTYEPRRERTARYDDQYGAYRERFARFRAALAECDE